MRYIRFLLWLLVVIFVISCTKKSNEYDISFQEQSFANDILATITLLNDSVYVVGGENGEIYLLKNDTVIADYKQDLGRIYCVYNECDTLYVGVRNSGIIKLVKNDNQLKLVKQYKIPQKETRYSPYAIIPYNGDTLISTTSNGLYYLKTDGITDILAPIHYGANSGEPFPFCSPIAIDNNVFIGTKKGIIIINNISNKPKSILEKKVISKIERDENNAIYTLSGDPGNDTLYVFTKSDTFSKPYNYELPFSALSFVLAEGKFYFVNEHELHVISDLDDLNNKKKEGNHVVIKLPHVSSPDARNLIIYDNHAKKIRIITQKALLSLPSENGIGESKSKICGICFDEINKKIYFQNANNEIFEYINGKASKIMQLASEEGISALSAYDETLYFISNHQQLKSIKVRGFLESIGVNSPDEICNLPDKSTAMYVDDSYIYVGVRDTLLRIRLTDKNAEPIVIGQDVKPYVTKIKKDIQKNIVYASTLNDGLFRLNQDTLYKNVQFQNDFTFTDSTGRKFLLLNNHYLRYYLNNQIVDSVSLRGYERLLFSKERQIGAVINKSEIQFFQIENERISLSEYESRHITPQACMIIGDSLYLAADEGMLKVHLPDLSTTPVTFDHTEYAWTETAIIFATIIFLLFILFLIVYKQQFAQKFKRRLKEMEEKYKNKLHLKETQFREEEKKAQKQYNLQLQQREEEHKSALSKIEQNYKDNEARLKHDIESEKVRFNKKIHDLEVLMEKNKEEYDKKVAEGIKKTANYLENEIEGLINVLESVDESLKDNSDYKDIKKSIEECKQYINLEETFNLDVSRLNETRKIIQDSKLRLNEMLIISLNRIWEKVARYCNKNKGIAEDVRKALNDGDLEVRIEQIKKCGDYLDKINEIKNYKAISSLNIEPFCNDIKCIIQYFDNALDNDKGVDWESLIEETYNRLCGIVISKGELKDGIINLEQDIKISLLYIEQIKQKEIDLSSDLANRLIDDSKRKNEFRNSIQFDENRLWNNISGDERTIGKALIDDLEQLSNDIQIMTEREDILSCLMSMVAFNDRINMSFLLILINGMIECYHKEKGPRFEERQKKWSELINNSIYQFFLMVNEHGTDKKIVMDFGGKEIITNHVRWNKEKGIKDEKPMVTYPYKILALTLALGKIIPNTNKQELKDYLNSPTSWIMVMKN